MKKFWPMRQIRPETEESLAIFQNTDPIVFVLFISLFSNTVSKRIPKEIYYDIKFKSVGL